MDQYSGFDVKLTLLDIDAGLREAASLALNQIARDENHHLVIYSGMQTCSKNKCLEYFRVRCILCTQQRGRAEYCPGMAL